MLSVLQKLNNVRISIPLLTGVLDHYAQLPDPPGLRGEARMELLLDLLKKTHMDAALATIAIAIDLRLLALRRLLDEGPFPGCNWPDDVAGPTLTCPAIQALADEPMILCRANFVCFDRDSFLSRLRAN